MAKKFTKKQAKAEKAGGVFVHAVPGQTVGLGDDSILKVPGDFRAELYVTYPAEESPYGVGGESQKETEQADSLGLLLERIAAYEVHRQGVVAAHLRAAKEVA